MWEDTCTEESSRQPQTQHQEVNKPISSNLRRCKIDSWAAEWANKPTRDPGLKVSASCFLPRGKVHLFPRAALRNYCKLGGLKPQNLPSHSCKSHKADTEMWASLHSLQWHLRQSFPASSNFWWPQTWGNITPIDLCLHLYKAISPLCLCVPNLYLSLIRTPVIGFKSILSPGWAHLEILT